MRTAGRDHRATLALAALLVGLLASAGAQAQQSDAQSRCIVALNSGLRKMGRAQWVHAIQCVRAGDAGLGEPLADCLASDPDGKLAALNAQLGAVAAAKCSQLPDIGPFDATAVAGAATASVNAVVRGLFGIGKLPSDGVGGSCQRAVANAARRCEDAVWRAFNTCKRRVLGGSAAVPITSGEDLATACLGTGTAGIPDPNGKIARACDPAGMLGRAASHCAARGVDLAAAFLGSAAIVGAPADGAELATSVRQLALCQACQALNDADNLARDCDLVDNAVDDGSCDRSSPEALQLTVATSQRVYAPGAMVSATVTIASTFAINGGALTVTAFDVAAPGGPSNALHQETVPVSVAAGGRVVVPIQFAATQAGSYVLLAELPTARMLGDGRTHFGIRPTITGLSDTILRATVEDLDVQSISTMLESGATSGAPVTLALGGQSVTVQVAVADPFQLDAGETLPSELAGMRAFEGKVCPTGSVPCAADSLVALVIGRTGGGSVPDALFGTIAETPEDALWIEPLGDYDAGAAASQHVLYRGQDTVHPDKPHGEPQMSEGQESIPAGSGAAAVRTALALHPESHLIPTECPFGQVTYKTVRLKVFEERVSNDFRTQSLRTGQRMLAIVLWRLIMKLEFQFIAPRAEVAALTVDDVVITGWTIVNQGRYGGSCADVLNGFTHDFPSTCGVFHVLFNTQGSDCGGMAILGGPGRYSNSIAIDNYPLLFTAETIGQEVGHNMDWHYDWTAEAHDAHLDVSEQWDHDHYLGQRVGHRHCTIMRATYDRCEEAELRYKRYWDVPLRHLAEGICRNTCVAPPPPASCANPTIVPADGGTFNGITSGVSSLSGCAKTDHSPEQVFQWTPSISGVASAQTCGGGTAYDTVLYVHQDDCATGSVPFYCPGSDIGTCQAACNDDACAGARSATTASRVLFSVKAGHKYFIVVDGYNEAHGRFSLQITPPTPPGGTTTTSPPTTTTTLPPCGATAPTCDGDCPYSYSCTTFDAGATCLCYRIP